MFLKTSWVVGLTALPIGAIDFALLCTFPEAIELYDSVEAHGASYNQGGPEALFMMSSGVFGWLCVIVAERRLGARGVGAWLLSVPWCLMSILGGFALAALFVGSFSEATWEMLAGSLATVAGACAVRAWWGTFS